MSLIREDARRLLLAYDAATVTLRYCCALYRDVFDITIADVISHGEPFAFTMTDERHMNIRCRWRLC